MEEVGRWKPSKETRDMSGLSELVSRERDKERRSAWLEAAIALTNNVKK